MTEKRLMDSSSSSSRTTADFSAVIYLSRLKRQETVDKQRKRVGRWKQNQRKLQNSDFQNKSISSVNKLQQQQQLLTEALLLHCKIYFRNRIDLFVCLQQQQQTMMNVSVWVWRGFLNRAPFFQGTKSLPTSQIEPFPVLSATTSNFDGGELIRFAINWAKALEEKGKFIRVRIIPHRGH